MRRSLRTWLPAALLALAFGVAACGGGDDNDGGGGGTTAEGGGAAATQGEARRGGKITMLWTDDVQGGIDCAVTYYTLGAGLCNAVNKSLFSYTPESTDEPVPDLASEPAQVSEDGQTVTVKLQRGIRFGPPVGREITSADVKYGIERGFFRTVNNPYAGAYFADIVGSKTGAEPGTKIDGIETPDDYTVVFRLKRPVGGFFVGALSMQLAAPVPEDYAKEFDAENPSTYGMHQIASGPYMYENDAQGNVTGYSPGERIHLVRNPNWDPEKDFRPAYVDEWDMPQGNDDTTVASRKILEGSAMVNGDVVPPPTILKLATSRFPDQLLLTPAGGTRYMSMNTKLAPFDDLNVRKAVIAGFDREAGLLARGGKLIGDIPTHYIPPGVAGFDESGGLKGFGFDFMDVPGGDMELAAKYFRAAGYTSGKYEGTEPILVVGTTEGVAQRWAEIAKENLEKLGFRVTLRLVTQDAMYDRFCNVPKAEVHVCPNVGWFKDWPDPQTLLDPVFNGNNILQEGNSNWPQLDVPRINQAMEDAKVVSGAQERADAWAAINRMVTEQAPAIPITWDKEPIVRSADVVGVPNPVSTVWDLNFTGLAAE